MTSININKRFSAITSHIEGNCDVVHTSISSTNSLGCGDVSTININFHFNGKLIKTMATHANGHLDGLFGHFLCHQLTLSFTVRPLKARSIISTVIRMRLQTFTSPLLKFMAF